MLKKIRLNFLGHFSKGVFTNYVYKILPPSPLHLHFVWYKSLQKVNFLSDHIPPSSYKLFNYVLFETQKMSTIAFSQLPFSIYFSKTVAIMDSVEMEKIMILSKWTNQWLQQNLLVVLARDFLMSFVAMVTYAEGIHLVRVYAVSFISEIHRYWANFST